METHNIAAKHTTGTTRATATNQTGAADATRFARFARFATPAVFAVLTLVFLLFALSVIDLPLTHVDKQVDGHGNSFSGAQSVISGEFIGPVQIIFTDAAIYEGDFTQNRFNGTGSFTGFDKIESTDATTGEAIETTQSWALFGTFVDGRLVGEGSYQDSKGSYRGNFENSLPHGQGVYLSNDGWRYEGTFTAGAITGQGTVYTKTGEVYAGLWQGGVFIS